AAMHDSYLVANLRVHRAIRAIPEEVRDALMRARSADTHYGANRLFVGRNMGGDATLVLNDASGNGRMVLKVTPDGEASIQFLDEDGEVVGELTPESVAG